MHGPGRGPEESAVGRERDDVVRCFIEATLKHSKAPGAVRASKKRYPVLHPVISRGCHYLGGGEADKIRIKIEKLREAKAGPWKRGECCPSLLSEGLRSR